MNVLFFLLPKAQCAYVLETDTLRQVIEKMEYHNYTAIPLLSKEGKYLATISDGDLLYHLKNNDISFDMTNHHNIMEVKIRKDIKPISINNNIESLVDLIVNQNFVPVIDDQEVFIGIITRKRVIGHLTKKYSLH